jgi:hypothetical protein
MRTKAKGGDLSPQQQAVTIKSLQRTQTVVTLMGVTPLITHAWSQKAKLEILSKHMGALKVREIRDPMDDFERSMYRFEDGSYGFPVVAIKEALATATVDIENLDRAKIYRNIGVTGRRGFQLAAYADLKSPHELAELFSPNAPAIREDMVKLAGIGRVPDIRYRAEFSPWALRFTLGWMEDFLSVDSLMNLLARSGYCVGLGEWRQERGGSNGLFRIADEHEVKMVSKWAAAGPQPLPKIDSKKWLAEVNAKAMERANERAETKTVVAKKEKRAKGNGATAGH